MKPISLLLAVGLAGALTSASFRVSAQGMPPEARANIHALFQGHDRITRTVKITEKGYIATTESDDPRIVSALQEHVRQMSARLESGLMVRRWDPAFAEYVGHYREIRHRFAKTDKGIRMTVTGKTPEAIRVAQNHAGVISQFVRDGWSEHDRSHPAVGDAKPAAGTSSECCSGGAKGPGCRRASSK